MSQNILPCVRNYWRLGKSLISSPKDCPRLWKPKCLQRSLLACRDMVARAVELPRCSSCRRKMVSMGMCRLRTMRGEAACCTHRGAQPSSEHHDCFVEHIVPVKAMTRSHPTIRGYYSRLNFLQMVMLPPHAGQVCFNFPVAKKLATTPRQSGQSISLCWK